MTRATIKSGTVNILNTIIGAGILAMPYGLRQNGLLLGCILIIWSACTSAFGLYLQNKVARYTGQRGSVSFFSLAQITYPNLSIIFDTAISIKCFGVAVSYLVVVGDVMPKIMESLRVDESSIFMDRKLWITIIMALVVAPLSFLKNLSSLKYTSVLALFSIAYLICLVIGNYLVEVKETHSFIPPKQIDWIGPVNISDTLSSLPLFVFSFTFQQLFFALLNELQPDAKDGSLTRQSNFIIWNALITALFCYLIVAIFGYFTFGRDVEADIITMYSPSSIYTLIGNISIVIMSALSFPLQCHPCRGSVNHVIYFIKNGVKSAKLRKKLRQERTNYGSLDNGYATSSDVESIASADTNNNLSSSIISTTPMEGAHDTMGHAPIVVPMTTRRFYMITTAIVLLGYIVALSVTSLARVLAFVGSTGSTSIAFILPGLFAYMLMKPLEPRTKMNNLEKFCKYGGLALAIWGFIVMITCLSAIFLLEVEHK